VSYGKGLYGSTIYALDVADASSEEPSPPPSVPSVEPIVLTYLLYPTSYFGPIAILQRSLVVNQELMCTFICLDKNARIINAPNYPFYNSTADYLIYTEAVSLSAGNRSVRALMLRAVFYTPGKSIIKTLKFGDYQVLLRLASR
jgi:hypothetical protein